MTMVGAEKDGQGGRSVGQHRFVRPHRPVAVRAANRAGRVLQRAGHPALSLDPAVMMRQASASVGLDDYGSDEFLEPLGVLCAALDGGARLTPVGRYFAHGRIVGSLRNRLLIEEAISTRPEMVSTPLAPPTVIVGLPRTGSTLLQSLIAQDPLHRPLLTWEAARPVPGGRGPDDRHQVSTRHMKILDYLAPAARSLHPIGPDLATECVTLMANSFASLELATINWVPTYLDWCLDHDLGPHYAYLYRQLQLLECRVRSERWVLKSPSHLFWLDDLLDAFPGARVIQTHRDPIAVVGSFCSLSSTFCSVGEDEVPTQVLARRWTEAWAEGLDRTSRVRASRPDVAVADVRYDELMRSPIAAVERVYAELDLELTPAAVAAMQAFLAGEGGTAAINHDYSLEQFGLDPAEEAERYRGYSASYGL